MNHPIFGWKLVLPFVLLSALWASTATAADPPFYRDKFDLMHYSDAGGARHPVRTKADWENRRRHIVANMELVMGPVPHGPKPPLDVTVISEVDFRDVIRRKITYQAKENDRVPAYLFIPKNRKGKMPAMVVPHPTSVKFGKGIPAGVGGRPRRATALELAERGYVTISGTGLLYQRVGALHPCFPLVLLESNGRFTMARRTFFALPLLAVGAVILSQSGFPQSDHTPLPYDLDSQWPQLPVGWNFQETPGVAVGPNQHVYVLHRGDHPIIEFDRDGRFIRSLGDGLFIRAHGIEVDREGNIWTVDNDTHMVLKMDRLGRVRMVLGRRGQSGEGEDTFNRPTDVAIAPNGDFYVSDGYGNSRVVKFSKDGKFITAWGKKGDGPGEFNLPHSVVLDNQGRVYVGDRENYRIQVFDSDGEFLHQWKHVGSPWGLDITADEKIFMADGHNNRVLKLDLDGKILGVLGGSGKLPGQFNYSHHLALDALGNLYVAEIKNWRVQRFVPK